MATIPVSSAIIGSGNGVQITTKIQIQKDPSKMPAKKWCSAEIARCGVHSFPIRFRTTFLSVSLRMIVIEMAVKMSTRLSIKKII